ncbi:MAG: thrombospondin type 3 repeat-containing protein [bacterium]
MRPAIKSLAALGLAGWLLGGCTLDFEEFRPYTEEPPPVLPDGDMDTPIVDLGVEMGPPIDMMPPVRDTDGDGVDDDVDNCVDDPNADQADLDGDGIGDVCDPDADGDDVADDVDNCLRLQNPEQFDLDRDGEGDACDDDIDGDGLDEAAEMARGTDPRIADTDVDGFRDGDDTCPLRADRVGLDSDGDGYGDACDEDDDGDGVRDWRDNCPGTANPDQAEATCAGDLDGDGIADAADNCPYVKNPDQAIAPCESAFQTLTYSRSTSDLALSEGGVIASTAGGALALDTDLGTARLTNADGLAGNRLFGVDVDRDNRWFFTTDRGLSVVRPDGFVFNLHADDGDGGPQGELREVAAEVEPEGPGATIWVSSSAGLNRLDDAGWSLVEGLPAGEVRGLWLDDLGRLWVAAGTAVVRFVDGAVERTFAELPDIGEVEDIAGGVGADVWILGENGAIRLLDDDSVAPGGAYTGFAARDLAAGEVDTYIAAVDGLRRIDRDGRLLPPGVAPLPSADLRAIVQAAEGGLWVGSAAGLLRIESYFATYGADRLGGNCATVTRRAGALIWIGTRDGARVIRPDGAIEPVENLPGLLVADIERVGDQVWIGTESGIGVYALDGTPIETIGPPSIPDSAVTDIQVGLRGVEVFVGTDGGGLAWRDAEGSWRTLRVADAPNQFLSDRVEALAYGGENELWIAGPLGLSLFQNGAFGAPVTTQGGRLPIAGVNDVAIGGGYLFAATSQGVAVRDPRGLWTTLRRQNDGLPDEAGSDAALSLVYDGVYLWVALDDSRRLEYGSILRRSPDPDVQGVFDLYPPGDVGLPETRADLGVDLTWAEGELSVSYCGDAQAPGGFGLLGGRSLVIEDGSAAGLRGEGREGALTHGPEGRPMVVGQTREGPVADRIVDAVAQPVTLPDAADVGVPAACGVPVVMGDNLWCVFNGVGFGRRFGNDQWNLGRKEQIPALGEGDLRDIVVETDTVAWLASAAGVIHVNGGSVRALNTAFTGNGLPDDDVRSVTLADGVLYAGTAGGVGVYDGTSWTAIGEDALPNASVRAVAVGPDGALWIGTDGGLFRRALDGATAAADYTTADGLPVDRINDVVALPDGRIVVATPVGVAVRTGDGPFVTYGFVDGLPGRAAYELVVDPEGEVWVRSDDGVGRLAPDRVLD